MDNIKFGNFILKLKKENNMTQKELAEKLHVTDKAISKWERGLSFPDIMLLKPLSEIFGITITELLNAEKQNSKPEKIEEKVLQIVNQLETEKRKKRTKTIFRILIVVLVVIMLGIGLTISKKELHTYNPIRAVIGYLQVTKFNQEYAIVGNFPLKTIYATSQFEIEQYMKDRGYIKEEGIKAGDDWYSNGKETIFITCWHRKGITIYEWESITPYREKKEKQEQERVESKIEVPVINVIIDANTMVNDII